MVPELKQGRCRGEWEGANSACGLSIRCAFCPCDLPLFQLWHRFNSGTVLCTQNVENIKCVWKNWKCAVQTDGETPPIARHWGHVSTCTVHTPRGSRLLSLVASRVKWLSANPLDFVAHPLAEDTWNWAKRRSPGNWSISELHCLKLTLHLPGWRQNVICPQSTAKSNHSHAPDRLQQTRTADRATSPRHLSVPTSHDTHTLTTGKSEKFVAGKMCPKWQTSRSPLDEWSLYYI